MVYIKNQYANIQNQVVNKLENRLHGVHIKKGNYRYLLKRILPHWDNFSNDRSFKYYSPPTEKDFFSKIRNKTRKSVNSNHYYSFYTHPSISSINIQEIIQTDDHNITYSINFIFNNTGKRFYSWFLDFYL